MKVDQVAYQFFCERVKHWAELFGMKDWKICLKQDLNMPPHAIADIYMKTVDRIALVRLCEELPLDAAEEDYNLDKHAFHEACHIMLCDLEVCAGTDISKGLRQSYVHSIIRRLENVFEEEGDRFVPMDIQKMKLARGEKVEGKGGKE